MSKPAKGIIAALAAIVLAVLALVFLVVKAYREAETAMPQDAVLVLREQENGTLLLQWPAAEGADYYTVDVLMPMSGGGEAQQLISGNFTETECELPYLPEDRELVIRVNSQREYEHVLEKRIRPGETPIEVACRLSAPEAAELTLTTDGDGGAALVTWEGQPGDVYELYCVSDDGDRQLLRTVDGQTSARIDFGPGGDLEMPEYGEEYSFVLESSRERPGVMFYGRSSRSVSVTREDLLSTVLKLEYTELGSNCYHFTWNETRGEYCEIQLLDRATGRWQTLHRYSRTDARSYTSEHLEPFADYEIRVVAHGGKLLPGSEFAAEPAQVAISTGASAIYATVWPIRELDMYADTGRQEIKGRAGAGTAYCVTGERNGLFEVRGPEGCGYIDSDYCMINLPDYLGDICSYDITNSYSAIYMVHGYEIPEVTDTVVSGYESVLTAEDGYLVPLLYPTAQKLTDAALAALEDGYRLKIYDSYRPNKATRSIYDLTYAVLRDPVPEKTFYGEPVDDLPEHAEGKELTYYTLVTKGVYSLGNFLASRGSTHNQGIALDLTLERLEDGEELEMQTSMHDLSWYSILSENNRHADLLSGYMKAAGFGGLSSEWWHFQDNDTRGRLELPYMAEGVSPEGWTADDYGWRYREADGSYRAGVQAQIGGEDYIFDENGYAWPVREILRAD